MLEFDEKSNLLSFKRLRLEHFLLGDDPVVLSSVDQYRLGLERVAKDTVQFNPHVTFSVVFGPSYLKTEKQENTYKLIRSTKTSVRHVCNMLSDHRALQPPGYKTEEGSNIIRILGPIEGLLSLPQVWVTMETVASMGADIRVLTDLEGVETNRHIEKWKKFAGRHSKVKIRYNVYSTLFMSN